MTHKFKHFITILLMAAITSIANAQSKIAFDVSFKEVEKRKGLESAGLFTG